MSTSSAPVIYDQLIEQFAALLIGKGESGNDVKVEDGGDYAQWTADEVWVQDIEEGNTVVPTIRAGRKKREEIYRITIRIRTLRIDRKESRDCAFAHFSEIEDWFAENPDLGLSIPTLRITDFEWEYQANYDEGSRGWRSSILIKPLVQIRLS